MLRGLGFDPVLRVAEVDETLRVGEAPEAYTRRLSLEKASQVAEMHGKMSHAEISPFVIGADTVVVLDDDVLEKPVDASHAREMLARLSGRWHTVVTSFTIAHVSGESPPTTRAVEAGVRFKTLTECEISAYVDSGEPMDKAGAYGIQKLGGFLVREVFGSYFTVVGLPVCEVVETLLEMGAITRFPFPGEVSP